MTERPILLLGTAGQVGAETLPLLERLGTVVGLRRADLDMTDGAAIRSTVQRLNPSWIVNAAAYTAVDKAENDASTAFAVNGDAPGILGEQAFRIGAPVIHLSTDYVFAGSGTRPWSEDDPTGPLNVYGASKLAGENALAASGAAHFIFRTSWVFGTVGHNFLLTILKLARERKELRIVDDQYGAPTWSRSLGLLTAQTIMRVQQRAILDGGSVTDVIEPLGGIYHACSAGCTTWFDFASEIIRVVQAANPEREVAKVIPVSSEEYPTPAARPKNSRLNCEKLQRRLAFEMPSWQESTSKVLTALSHDSDKK